jgi:uncharacterized protein
VTFNRLIVFLLVVTFLDALAHYYVWLRLVRDTDPPRGVKRALTVFLVIAAIAMPLALGTVRSGAVARPVYWVAFAWMGTLFLLVVSLLPLEMARLFAWFRARRADEPASPERRTALSRMLGGVAAVTGVGAATYGVAVALSPVIERVRVPLRRLPLAMDGFRIVQITDVHVGPTIQKRYIEEIVAMVNALSPDLVAITGDLVDGTVEGLAEHVQPLASLRARQGVFFVTGNHEFYSGMPAWIAHLGTLGIRVLENEHVMVGSGEDGFYLAGCHDYNAGALYDMDRALSGISPDREIVLLAHQPRSIFEAARRGVGLQLSGHTHGGQIFPWRFLVFLQQPFVEGLHRLRDTFVYVSRGTGFWGPPIRVGARAEIAEITLTRG